jgi:hypothetical protein
MTLMKLFSENPNWLQCRVLEQWETARCSISLSVDIPHKYGANNSVKSWDLCIVKILMACKYSRIPLIRHRQNQTDARLSNILDYQAVQILTKFLTGNFLLLCSQPSENVLPVSYFHFVIKRLSFFSYHRPIHGFSFGTHCCKPLMQHLVKLPKYQDFRSTSIRMKGILLYLH